MKKLLFILLLSPIYSLAQIDKVVDDKIAASNALTDKKIDAIFIGDTVIRKRATCAGNLNWDTLTCPLNTMTGYRFALKGFSKSTQVYGTIDVWVKNIDGVYTVFNGTNVNLTMGIGYSLKGVKVGNLIILQMIYGTTVMNWTLTKTQLL